MEGLRRLRRRRGGGGFAPPAFKIKDFERSPQDIFQQKKPDAPLVADAWIRE